ncbi:MAG TPA: hypothetical protein VEK80_05200 [Kribbellaceae bacterium]|nr:hypothetical protein [Kribbellaceae bacterium]
MSPAATRRVILAGANPGVRLFDTHGKVSAFASIWSVDWSERGSGSVIVLWYDGVVRVVADDVDLAAWLESYFVRSFLEVQGLPWPDPLIERELVQVSLDLSNGLTAKGGDVHIEMGGVLDRRVFTTDRYLLGGVEHSLSLLIAPVRTARIDFGGETLPGRVRVDGSNAAKPSSSAFLTTAEVWSR